MNDTSANSSLFSAGLLDDLRSALIAYFAAPGSVRSVPNAVDFRITEEHDYLEGLAWAGDGALLLHGTETEPAEDLTESVGDELDALTEYIGPKFGDTLVITLTPGYEPPATDDDRITESQPAVFDPQNPGLYYSSLDEKTLLEHERAVLDERESRVHRRLTEVTIATLPVLAKDGLLESTAPVCRVVFNTSMYEEGPRWSCWAHAHHADGTVSVDLDVTGELHYLLDELTDLMYPEEESQLIIEVPDVELLVEACTVCHDTACRAKGAGLHTSCGACPAPFTVSHHAHPATGCSGFSFLP